jgi:hypothetical protein
MLAHDGIAEEPTNGELQRELTELKISHNEFRSETREKLGSIDLKLDKVMPLLAAHEERFKTLDAKCIVTENKIKGTDARVLRLELGIFGALVMVVVGVVSWAWAGIAHHIFPQGA